MVTESVVLEVVEGPAVPCENARYEAEPARIRMMSMRATETPVVMPDRPVGCFLNFFQKRERFCRFKGCSNFHPNDFKDIGSDPEPSSGALLLPGRDVVFITGRGDLAASS